MRYTLQSPHLKVSSQIEFAILEKFLRFEKLFDRIEKCQVTLKREKNGKQKIFMVEAKLSVPGNDLFVSEQAASFEIAAEKACFALENQIKKHKAKLNVNTARSVDQIIQEEELE